MSILPPELYNYIFKFLDNERDFLNVIYTLKLVNKKLHVENVEKFAYENYIHYLDSINVYYSYYFVVFINLENIDTHKKYINYITIVKYLRYKYYNKNKEVLKERINYWLQYITTNKNRQKYKNLCRQTL